MKSTLNTITAITKRDMRRYFSNPTGFLFITLFILLSASAAFWQERFFLDNLANLNQLNTLFPLILILFIPSITMNSWAEEKKRGTEELLHTLPTSMISIVIGKFLALFGIYTISLLLSMSHVIILKWLGTPDMGLMVSNYFGYWLLGGALITVGMVASLITSNATVAFISGALLCATVTYLNSLFSIFGNAGSELGKVLSTPFYFEPLAKGVIPFASIVYFGSLAALGLYINTTMLSKGLWSIKKGLLSLGLHYAVRISMLFVALFAVNVIVQAHVNGRIDITEEKLHSLSKETVTFLKDIPENRPVTIKAFISKTVPSEFAESRANLLGFLNEVSAVAGAKVKVVINETEEYTDEAIEAREQYNIYAKKVQSLDGVAKISSVFMGVVFSCGTEEQVIPFFDKGLPVEYELVRSLKVVTNSSKKKIGILKTALNLNGSFDYRTGAQSPQWSVVSELKKQYDVEEVSASAEITAKVDVLLAALPSTMTQAEIDNLQKYIEAGNPTLLMVDPLPVVNPELAPMNDPNQQRNPFMQQPQQPKPAKGNIEAMLSAVGIQWAKGDVIWDEYNPHPMLTNNLPEIVFLGAGNKNENTFSTSEPVTSDLQELVLLFPGVLKSANKEGVTVTPLLECGVKSGRVNYSQLFSNSFFGPQLNPQAAPHIRTPQTYTHAVRVSGEASKDDSTAKGINLIAIADVDFISEQFFELRKQGVKELNFDNVTFLLNSVDYLTGDNSLLALRKKRVKHRTLSTVEKMKSFAVEAQKKEREAAELRAEEALAEANKRLKERVDEVQNRADLDNQTKKIMMKNAQEAESKRFEAKKSNIESDKERAIQSSEEVMLSQIKKLQNNIKMMAVLLPPIPVFLVGIFIFFRRRKRELEGAKIARRYRG